MNSNKRLLLNSQSGNRQMNDLSVFNLTVAGKNVRDCSIVLSISILTANIIGGSYLPVPGGRCCGGCPETPNVLLTEISSIAKSQTICLVEPPGL